VLLSVSVLAAVETCETLKITRTEWAYPSPVLAIGNSFDRKT